MSESPYARFERRLIDWLSAKDDIYGAVVIGSRGRLINGADEADINADLDVIIYCHDVTPYIHTAWYAALGDVVFGQIDWANDHDPEWYIVYADGLRFDPMLVSYNEVSAPPTLTTWIAQPRHDTVLMRGARVLYDATDSGAIRVPPLVPSALPTQAQLDEILHQTWWDALKIEACLRRGSIFEAKMITDTRMKNRLLKMLQWEAAARGVDAWYNGRFIDQWAAPDVLAVLPSLFPAYDAADIVRAAWATVELIESTARKVAAVGGLRFPEHTAQRIRANLTP